jgi:tetratricopeptide (TPR) repeat protein
MTKTRPLILMGVLLCLVLGYVSRPLWSAPTAGTASIKLPTGKSSISGLGVRRDAEGRWFADVDYVCGAGAEPAFLELLLKPDGAVAAAAFKDGIAVGFATAQSGARRASIEITRPPIDPKSFTTAQVIVQMTFAGQPLASQELAQRIDWPDMQSWMTERQYAGKTNEQLLGKATSLIDDGNRATLDEAKRILERILARDSRFEMGYVELARVAMKTNWGPEGLRQAESFLSSALQIQPQNVNAKILLGYVFAHQERYKAAEALFSEASQTDSKNLWLWSNWGEALAMQGRTDAAIEKYRTAITRPRTHDTYDRARLDAYAHLLFLLEQRNDLNGLETLHKQRTDEFGAGSCYGAEYARFMLQQRGNTEAAITLAKQSIASNCQGTAARHALGLAYYQSWAAATGERRVELINQARIYLPAGPELVYQLAGSDRTLGTLKQLLSQSESLDQRDNNKWNALSYAIGRKDAAAVRRLLLLGAKPDGLVGPSDIPAALLPVLEGDAEAASLLRKAGVDFSKIRFQGSSAIEIAKRIGDRRLVEALEQKTQSL